jgi:hypothetical protein
MSKVFEAMHEWSRGVDGAEIDEGEHELEIGAANHKKTVQNHTCTAKASLGGRKILLSWSSYLAEGFTSRATVRRDVLDVFVADEGVALEGALVRRGGLAKLLAGWGIGVGPRPIEHALFKAAKLHVEEERGPSPLAEPSYCALALGAFAAGCFKLEFQAATGGSAYYEGVSRDMTAASLEAVVARQIELAAG